MDCLVFYFTNHNLWQPLFWHYNISSFWGEDVGGGCGGSRGGVAQSAIKINNYFSEYVFLETVCIISNHFKIKHD